MGILARFNDIINSNVNALLDKMEDPSKMIDQYLRNLTKSLAEVKEETASVMAEEARTRRMTEENQADIQKYTDLAKKALQNGSEEDARVFIAKKQDLEAAAADLAKAYAAAKDNSDKMKQLHDKLISDIETLNSKREALKAKIAVAKTQEKMNSLNGEKATAAFDSFARMEDRIDQALDRADAMNELNAKPVDNAAELEKKYAASAKESAVSAELEQLKKELNL